MNGTSTLLGIRGLAKSFGGDVVLQPLDLDIHDGEFFTILGPSGCGKTTILRMIAGLEQPDAGTIHLGGLDLTPLPPDKRPLNTVFQRYALFPHMTVFDNVAFGLRMHGVAPAELEQRVHEALAMVKLDGMALRKPHQLSGGQQQRVAIARAVVNKPRLLLLDESLSALDHKLRQAMQVELKQLQRKLGITFVYVTHDQEEALAMSDRVMVMNNGLVQQIGTPRAIYETPANLFVAEFIGEINRFDAKVLTDQGNGTFEVEILERRLPIKSKQPLTAGEHIHVLLRPEDLRIQYFEDAPPEHGLLGYVQERNYKGKTLDSLIELRNGQTVLASEFFDEDDPDFDYRINQKVIVTWVQGWEVVLPHDAP